ncbi:ABC transporter permease [Xinfangfangia sp. CPCC 101601]|uniref:Transport permease protein n=1 Tax=Pseudogemmobacter lacusdianii TaxID=3069608 RepID=A0ABU0VZV8_9RHOB|nr:ABC transporter permease [Xinfangfangia sp. CPCC 101601]MDQ2067262.1 ABC transporter permease [Xinfangfangia sp. CPCC 101601]
MNTRLAPAQTPIATQAKRRFASFRAIAALMLREMTTTYGKSPGGYAWAVLEPVAGVAILTYAFSFLFAKPPLGTSFELFYATGTLPFFMFTTISNRVSTAILFSKPLLAYPAVTFVDALIARFAVNLFTELFVFYLVMVGILALYDTRAVVDVPHVAMSLALTALFALGVGVLNSYLFLRWHIWHVAWAIISRPLFIISGAFFMYDALPAALREWLWYNPLIHVVGLMRSGFYPTYDDHYVMVSYVVGVSLGMILTGLFLLSGSIKTLLYEA